MEGRPKVLTVGLPSANPHVAHEDGAERAQAASAPAVNLDGDPRPRWIGRRLRWEPSQPAAVGQDRGGDRGGRAAYGDADGGAWLAAAEKCRRLRLQDHGLGERPVQRERGVLRLRLYACCDEQQQLQLPLPHCGTTGARGRCDAVNPRP